jgi:uncharacterized protein YggE
MQATTVAAQGLAEAPYTIANFGISLSSKGKSVPEAKRRLKAQIEDLNLALLNMQKDLSLEFVKNSVHTSSQVQEDWEYVKNNREMQGYLLTYTLSFQIDDLEKVNKVFDVLTSLSEARVTNPTFGLKPAQREKLSKKALKNAFAKAYERFATECGVLGLDVSEFEIANWEVSYHDSRRGNRVAGAMAARASASNAAYEGASLAAMGPEGPTGPVGAIGPGGMDAIDLVSGLAQVVVNIEVGYAKKTTPAPKPETVLAL